MMRQAQLCSLILGATIALAACGGGGGESSAVAAVPLSAANYTTVTGNVVDSVSVMDVMTGSVGVVTAASAEGSASAVQLSGTGPMAVVRYALTQVKRLGTEPKLQAQAATTEQLACYSGSLTVTDNDADNNNQASRGDSLTVVANNCVPAAGETAVNGRLSLVLGAVTVDSNGDLVSGAMTLSFTNFSTDGITVNGSAVMNISSSAVSMDFNRLSASGFGDVVVLDYKVTVASNQTAVVDGLIELNGSAYTLSTPAALQVGGANPSGGMLRIADGHGNRVDVVMSSTGYTGSLYLKGDEIVDGTATQRW